MTAVAIGACFTVGAVLMGPSLWMHWATRRRVFATLTGLPKFETAIVLGCAPTLGDGRPNLYFETRLDATAELYSAGRVSTVIVSGGPLPHTATTGAGGSECEAMLRGLVARGVPEARVLVDELGLRTQRSVDRARAAFGLREVVFVTQNFHARRAVYLAQRSGLSAVAYTAPGPPLTSTRHLRLLLREVFSRARAMGEGLRTK